MNVDLIARKVMALRYEDGCAIAAESNSVSWRWGSVGGLLAWLQNDQAPTPPLPELPTTGLLSASVWPRFAQVSDDHWVNVDHVTVVARTVSPTTLIYTSESGTPLESAWSMPQILASLRGDEQ